MLCCAVLEETGLRASYLPQALRRKRILCCLLCRACMGAPCGCCTALLLVRPANVVLYGHKSCTTGLSLPRGCS